MKRWIVSLLTLSSLGCGWLKIRDVNKVEVQKVRRVALASFSFVQPQASTVLGAGGPDMQTHESEEVTACWNQVASTLKQNMRWNVLPAEQMVASAAYKKVYETKMKGWQTNKVPHQGSLFLVTGVMDAQSLRRMKPSERDLLMDALKVDALLETQVNIAFASSGVSVMGIGPRYPQATINLWMYKRGVEAPVWFDGRMWGEASKKSVGATGYFDPSEVTHLGHLSAKSAFEKIDLKLE